MEASVTTSVQIFGVKGSSAARAAERFFKERRVQIHYVDLQKKPMSPGELRRFIERFTLAGLIDTESKEYVNAGLKYLKMTESDLLAKVENEPKLLRLPFVRAGNRISIGDDPEAWKAMIS